MSTIDLRCGDALEQLKTLPDGSVDLVLTDPPYNIGVQETQAGSKKKCYMGHNRELHQLVHRVAERVQPGA